MCGLFILLADSFQILFFSSQKSSRKGWQSPDTSLAPQQIGGYQTLGMVKKSPTPSVTSPIIRVTSVDNSSIENPYSTYSSTKSKQQPQISTMKSYFSPSRKKSINRNSAMSTTSSTLSSSFSGPDRCPQRLSSADSLNGPYEPIKRFSIASSNSSSTSEHHQFRQVGAPQPPQRSTYILDNSHFQKKTPVTTTYYTNNNNQHHHHTSNSNNNSTMTGETILNNNHLVPAGVAAAAKMTTGRNVDRLNNGNNSHLLPSHNLQPQVAGATTTASQYHHHVVSNALSSPESAYSTGYSTDGNSPSKWQKLSF